MSSFADVSSFLLPKYDGLPYAGTDWDAQFDVAAFAELCLVPGDSRLQALLNPNFVSTSPILLKDRVTHASEILDTSRQYLLISTLYQLKTDAATRGQPDAQIEHDAKHIVNSKMATLKAEAVAQENAEMAKLRAIEVSAWAYFRTKRSIGDIIFEIVSRFGSDAGAVRAMVGSVARWTLSNEHGVAINKLNELSISLNTYPATASLGRVVGLVAQWKGIVPSAHDMSEILNLPTDFHPGTRADDIDVGDAQSQLCWAYRSRLMVSYLAFAKEAPLSTDLPSLALLVDQTAFTFQHNRLCTVQTWKTNIEKAIGIDDAFLIAVGVPLLRAWAPDCDIDALFLNRYSQARMKLCKARFPGLDNQFGSGYHTETFHSRDAWVNRLCNLDSVVGQRANAAIWPAMAQSIAEDYYPVLTRAQIFAFSHNMKGAIDA